MPFGLAGGCTMKDLPFWPISRSQALIAHEKLPQNLDLGFLSTIFAFCTKTDDDVSMMGPIRQMTWHDDISRVASACMKAMWQYRWVMMWRYGRCDDVARVTRQEASAGGDITMVTCY